MKVDIFRIFKCQSSVICHEHSQVAPTLVQSSCKGQQCRQPGAFSLRDKRDISAIPSAILSWIPRKGRSVSYDVGGWQIPVTFVKTQIESQSPDVRGHEDLISHLAAVSNGSPHPIPTKSHRAWDYRHVQKLVMSLMIQGDEHHLWTINSGFLMYWYVYRLVFANVQKMVYEICLWIRFSGQIWSLEGLSKSILHSKNPGIISQHVVFLSSAIRVGCTSALYSTVLQVEHWPKWPQYWDFYPSIDPQHLGLPPFTSWFDEDVMHLHFWMPSGLYNSFCGE